MKRFVSVVVAAALFTGQIGIAPARADNPMGYQLITEQVASNLPRRGGVLGIDIASGQSVNDSSGNFQVLEIKAVRSGSAADQAGLRRGDQIIAMNGVVFPSPSAFASYAASIPPGTRVSLDYMPFGGGPQEASRVTMIVGSAASAAGSIPQPSAYQQQNAFPQQNAMPTIPTIPQQSTQGGTWPQPGRQQQNTMPTIPTIPAQGAGSAVPQTDGSDTSSQRGLSTGTKLAIGAAAIALFGCYKTGCFSRNKAAQPTQTRSP